MKIKKKILLAVLAACLLLFTVSCEKLRSEEVKDGETFIFYLNGEMTGLVKSKYTIGDGDVKEEALAMLVAMKKNPEDIDRYSAFPQNLEILGLGYNEGHFLIDMNSAYQTADAVSQALFRAAVVQSLVQIEGIDDVGFSVSGNGIKDENGNLLGFQNADDYVQNTGSALHSSHEATLELYFANEAGDKLVAETVDVSYSSNVPIEKIIIEHIIAGPSKSGLYRTISSDVKVLGVTSKEGICYVNLSESFLNNTCDVIPEVAVYSLVNSIVEGSGVTQVQISVNGQSEVTYMDTFDLSKPLMADPRLISTEK